MLPTIATGNVGSALAGEYEVANSLRFDDGSSTSLKIVPSSTGNRKTFSISTWVKRGNLSAHQGIIGARYFDGDTNGSYRNMWIRFTSSDTFMVYDAPDQGANINLQTNAVFRDVSAWYHIVVAVDTTQATASNRVKIYINGIQETSFSTSIYPSLNQDTEFNLAGNEIYIGTLPAFTGGPDSNRIFNGYIAEACLIDGTALDPTSFGEFDEDTGIWKPIDVSGLTFGTNGFYLPFENSGALGQDDSGNGNNFTVNNLTSIDQTTDTCTNNFATMNSLQYSPNTSFSNGNLTVQQVVGGNGHRRFIATLGASSGKYYWENKVGANTTTGFNAGITNGIQGNYDFYIGDQSNDVAYNNNGQVAHLGSTTTGLPSFTIGDILSFALDLDNSYIYFAKNGTWINSGDPTSGATGTGGFAITSDMLYHPATSLYINTSIAEVNFGNPPYSISSGNSDGNGYGNFEYSVPSGYYALNTKNLAEYG